MWILYFTHPVKLVDDTTLGEPWQDPNILENEPTQYLFKDCECPKQLLFTVIDQIQPGPYTGKYGVNTVLLPIKNNSIVVWETA